MTKYNMLAEDIRRVLNQLNEYVVTEKEAPDFAKSKETDDTEDTDVDQGSGEPVDDLLTQPAGLEKVAGNLNVDALISMLEIPEDKVEDFKGAINSLRSDEPKLTPDQAMALAMAFNKMLTIGNQGKSEIPNALRQARKGDVAETDMQYGGRPMKPAVKENAGWNTRFDTATGLSHAKRSLQAAAEKNPAARDLAQQVLHAVEKGGQNRSLDEGFEGILSAIIYTVNLASSGNKSELLHMLDAFEEKYEGDHYAFDPQHWLTFVSLLKKLGRSLMQPS